ncbi:HHL008Wp [Eremothecium sinecaudum]|uniref:HHL008Wp n=1 Tax=Eremothecium sinecaudum TaxID=45286 RepID=A0A0X8HWE8_9SACH|nr:HHL008Wp [Eremothecium sinecaudum]AMD22762.1 HHL008Wp [Eremothecium sinecaudum]
MYLKVIFRDEDHTYWRPDFSSKTTIRCHVVFFKKKKKKRVFSVFSFSFANTWFQIHTISNVITAAAMSDNINRRNSHRWISVSKGNYDGTEWESDNSGDESSHISICKVAEVPLLPVLNTTMAQGSNYNLTSLPSDIEPTEAKSFSLSTNTYSEDSMGLRINNNEEVVQRKGSKTKRTSVKPVILSVQNVNKDLESLMDEISKELSPRVGDSVETIRNPASPKKENGTSFQDTGFATVRPTGNSYIQLGERSKEDGNEVLGQSDADVESDVENKISNHSNFSNHENKSHKKDTPRKSTKRKSSVIKTKTRAAARRSLAEISIKGDDINSTDGNVPNPAQNDENSSDNLPRGDINLPVLPLERAMNFEKTKEKESPVKTQRLSIVNLDQVECSSSDDETSSSIATSITAVPQVIVNPEFLPTTDTSLQGAGKKLTSTGDQINAYIEESPNEDKGGDALAATLPPQLDTHANRYLFLKQSLPDRESENSDANSQLAQFESFDEADEVNTSDVDDTESTWEGFPTAGDDNDNDDLQSVMDTRTIYDNQTIFNVPGILAPQHELPPLPSIVPDFQNQQEIGNDYIAKTEPNVMHTTANNKLKDENDGVSLQSSNLRSHSHNFENEKTAHHQIKTNFIPYMDTNALLNSDRPHSVKIEQLNQHMKELSMYDTNLREWISYALSSTQNSNETIFDEFKLNKHARDAQLHIEEVSKLQSVTSAVRKKAFSHSVKVGAKGFLSSFGKKL